MILNFKHKGLENFFLTGSKAGIIPDHANKLQLILARLNVSTSTKDMNLPGLFLHKLIGNRNDYWSVKVNANWRVTFKFKGENAEIVDYEDYH
jgi:proteic killer suppression protein